MADAVGSDSSELALAMSLRRRATSLLPTKGSGCPCEAEVTNDLGFLSARSGDGCIVDEGEELAERGAAAGRFLFGLAGSAMAF